MANETRALDPHALLEHAAWLRRLAVALVGDGGGADDLVQETWLAALRRPPADDRPVRPWLRRVLENGARFRWRGARNRAAREERVASLAEAEAASPAELLERHETQQLLARLVGELDEPYRATILLRYAEGLTPTEIARHLDVPAGTVRWRLKEGLARLRAGLDDAHGGDRRAWVLAFAPLASPGAASAPAAGASTQAIVRGEATGVPARGVVAVVAVATVVVVALIVAWSFARPSAPAVSRGGEARVTPSFAAAGQPRASRVSEDAYAKLRALAADRPAGWIAQEGVRARRIAGRVVDGGKPAVGALVRLTSELSLAGMVPALEQRTDADGRFDFGEQVAREYAVGAAAPGRLAAILRIDLRHPSPSQPADALELSLLPCATELYGVVTDAGGSPVPHARLLREDVIGTEAGADGRYALCVLPMATFVDALQVVVRADGYGAAVIEATPSGRVRRDIVLTPEAVVAGRVVDEHGAPVALAKVWLEPDLGRRRPPEQSATLFAVTGDDGRFRIEGVRAGQHRVGAAARGQTAQRHTVALAAGERDELVLTLAATGQLRGRVVRNGQPVIGATVRPRYGVSDSAVSQPDGSFVLDRVPPGEIELTAYPYVVKSPETVAVTGGAATDVTLQVAHMASLRGTIRRHGTPVPYARVTVRGPSQLAARADAEGRYQLEGLYPGTHVYVADDVRMRAFGDGEVEIAEGEDRVLDLELTSGARVAGMVVDAAGQPVASAFVRLRAASGDEGRCVTDDRGAFDCASMTGGAPYVLGVFAGDDTSMPYPFAGPAPAPIALADGDAFVDGVRVSVDPRRLAISGTVVDAEGHAIPDARVQAWGVGARRDWRWNAAPSAVTDIDGMFTIASLAPGTYGLEVSVLDGPRGARRDVDAGATGVTLVVEEPTCVDPSQTSRVRDEPAGLTSRPVGRVVWGEGAEIIELLGWNLPGTVRRGEPFTITTYYRTIAPPDRAWAVFVHIDGGKARHQADHDPLGGTCSSSTWQPGDILIDRVTTTINPKWVPPGRYTVWTGFYTGWAPTWRNFEVHAAPASMRDSNHRIKIADIVLE